MKPRGLRNCNPGNIRLSSDQWRGLREEQTDEDFFQFQSMAWGYRALIRTLQNYRRKHNCWTIRDFITRWAPSCENNTLAYIKSVCNYLGVPSVYVPDVDDKDTMCALAAAMSRHENGIDAIMQEVSDGWDLL